MEADRFDLVRFVDAQAGSGYAAGYETALDELRRGSKQSHWMWYIFPQIAGLGSSPMAQRYAIGSLAEAQAFLAHPVLGPRLRACVATLQALPAGASAARVFGSVDAMKLRSSLTLFAAAGGGALFGAALDRWGGGPDPRTLALLKS